MKSSLLIIIMATATSLSYASTKACKSLKSCVQLVSKLTGENYLYTEKLKGEVFSSNNFQITKENAGDFLSEVLYSNGFTRVHTKKNQWTIISARDVRYVATPHYIFGKDKVPNNHDHVMLTIKLKNKYLASELSRNFRPFMSRYGRVVDIPATGTLIISDTGRNINRILSIIKGLDKKFSPEQLDEYLANKKKQRQKAIIKAKNCSDIKMDLQEIKAMLYKD